MLYRRDRYERAENAAAITEFRAELARCRQIEVYLNAIDAAITVRSALAKLIPHDYSDPSSTTVPRMSPIELKCELSKLPRKQALSRLMRKADAGCNTSRGLLRELMFDCEDLMGEVSNTLTIAKTIVLDAMSGDSYAMREAMGQKLAEAESALAGSNGSGPVDKMAAEAVSLAWIDCLRCQLMVLKASHSNRDERYLQGLADRATRRLERLTKILGTPTQAGK
ncbi:hypothetical protein Enr13x_20470 [Stieleria neptunia]|uniref:Uncharacterized protein n=1 Tax=Stieleria neptunia TaxID=2527979 RepID=A0A518HMX0_9BACT|nr:hypothetical protein [Stieleria neptunia]QDV42202.1 hypothetical protein Enr13x_20470 [Stieleria neptunia]